MSAAGPVRPLQLIKSHMAAGPKSKALMSGIGLEELNELAKPPEPQQPEAEVRLPVFIIQHHRNS